MKRTSKIWHYLCLLGLLSAPVFADSIKVATWNIEWLTTSPIHSIKESKRSNQDFSLLNAKFHQIAPDVLAFQEVGSKDAIEKVVGPFYRVYLSDRSKASNRDHQFDDLNQYTGFAVSTDWQVKDPRDIELSPNSKLRFASYIILQKTGEPDVHLLSVHLKHGCAAAKKSSRSCRQLEQQGQALNQWMKQRVADEQAFIVMGDFNHNLSFHNDWLWRRIQQGIENKIELITETTPALCQVKSNRDPNRLYRYPQLIDHIIISKPSRGQEAKQVLFTREEALYHHLSDHCPVVSQVEVRL
ncbi:endonuclease/exonuclease/phosphatase family protein [Vibrio gangliei]|uniref:endonuclease/exonuclease/phosphatase family protein n=1 Tax=Vibrio gangliei TaxID=2077090 RepID=UPI000D01C284|nr:endonuclease/exonuclease/phosphatase family protein [Vibrio gangliei]